MPRKFYFRIPLTMGGITKGPKRSEKTVREAVIVGRDYQIIETDAQGISVTIFPPKTEHSRCTTGPWVTTGRCPARLASVPITANYKQ